ncbi:MAG: glycosyltransferase family 4 protein, partial [Terrimicrobiaceae bacterium]
MIGSSSSSFGPPTGLPGADSPTDLVIIIRALVPYWEEAIDALAVAWGDRGQVTVISGGSGEDALHPWESPQGNMKKARLIEIPPEEHGRFGTVWPRPEVWKTLEQLNPSLVVIHEYSPFVILSGLLWAKAAGKPCVVTSDVGPVQSLNLTRSQKAIHSLVNSIVDGVLARTQDALDQSLISRKSGLLAPHAIDTRFYNRQIIEKKTPNRIIQVGSLIPRKGVDLLLRAFAEAKKVRPDLELVFVGSGDIQTALRMAGDLGVASAVTIRDFLPPLDLVQEYAKSDVFVLASRFDSYGVVVHEAAAAGLPLVISKFAGASATLVVPGINGAQVDPHDTAQFSEAILEALDPERNREYSRASREIAERFDVHSVAFRTATWFHQLLESSGKPSQRENRSRLSGWIHLLRDLAVGPSRRLLDIVQTDALSSEHRDIVFLNRYVPFYREEILKMTASWRTAMVIYSGKTLGNLKTVEGVESTVVPSHEARIKGANRIFWLAASLKLMRIRPEVVCTEMSLSLLSTWWLFFLRPFLGYGIVFWTHGFQNFGWREKRVDWKDRLRLLWIKWADAILFYSEARRSDVEMVTGPSDKYFVAPNTLDTEPYRVIYDTLETSGREAAALELSIPVPSMIYVGRLTSDKE